MRELEGWSRVENAYHIERLDAHTPADFAGVGLHGFLGDLSEVDPGALGVTEENLVADFLRQIEEG